MNIMAVTGTRADWGLLRPVLRSLRQHNHITVRLAMTGQHLVDQNSSIDIIRSDGFHIDDVVDMGLGGEDSGQAVGEAMGRGLTGFATLYGNQKPDLILILGDRYEALSAASAALVARIPIAHIAGGDVTEGAFDDAIRHAITKIASLHFTTNLQARQRIIQMGEEPDRVFATGSPGIDAIMEIPRIPRSELLADIGLPRDVGPFALATFHPATLSDDNELQCGELLRALDYFPDLAIVFTGSNADPGARAVERQIMSWVDKRPNAVFHASLGSRRYFSALAVADLVIGNSSSGLYEAPTFGIPTVNIGDRQARRPRAISVVDCIAVQSEIIVALKKALKLTFPGGVENPYGDGQASQRIAGILAGISNPTSLVRKSFRDSFE